MRAHALADTLSTVTATLTEDFHTDLVRVVLFEATPGFAPDWLRTIPRADPALADMLLLKRGNRLSITPVAPAHWRHIQALLGA